MDADEREVVRRLGQSIAALIEEAGGIDRLHRPPGYRHLGLSILDAVLSLRLRYSRASRRLEYYCSMNDDIDWNDLDSGVEEHDVPALLERLGSMTSDQIGEVFGRLKAPGTQRPRLDVVVEIAETLRCMQPAVLTHRDFRAAVQTSQDEVARRLMAIHGVGPAAWRYLIVLNRLPAAKPDTMIVRWVRRELGDRVTTYRSPEAIGRLFEMAARAAAESAPGLDVRTADHLVWRRESGRPIARSR